MPDASSQWITLGRISGLFGVRGWFRIFSHTEPRDNILHYSPWYLWLDGRYQTFEVDKGQSHGKGIIASLKGISDRDRAAALIGLDICIPREQLPSSREGEYYWHDLIGLQVVTVQGVDLGRVDHLMETGANDVLVVRPSEESIDQRERWLPYQPEVVVKAVDLAAGTMLVDWDPDF